jgi:hypothetical protein
MPQVQLEDQLFEAAKRRAADAGFSSIDEYIADVVVQDIRDEAANLDQFFTPERLAHIDKAEADIKAGKFYTTDQTDAELSKRRKEWLRTNPR